MGWTVVPGGGVEPPRPEGRRILRPSALTPKPLLSYELQRLAENGPVRSVTFGTVLLLLVGHNLGTTDKSSALIRRIPSACLQARAPPNVGAE